MVQPTKKVNALTNVGTLQQGDVVVGERVDGTTVRMTVPALSGAVDSVNTKVGVVVITPDDLVDTSTTNKFVTAADITILGNTSGTNTGDQTNITGNAATVTTNANLTGPVTSTGNATSITDKAVTLAKMDDIATSSLIYRKTAGIGVPEINTLATVKTDLGLAGTNSGDQTSIVGITGTKADFNTAVTDGDIVYTDSLATGVDTFLATPSSANLAAALTDETGSGAAVFSTSPTLVTPVLGEATATSLQLSNTGLLDTNGAPVLSIVPTVSAVNGINIINAPAGNAPVITVSGTDANQILEFRGKGVFGAVRMRALNTTVPFIIGSGTSYQHNTNFQISNTAATRTITIPDATGSMLMSTVAINSVPSITFSSTSGVIGTTTNDFAAAGSVGEIIQSVIASGSYVSLTTATATNLTSISLTAGDWDVWGNVSFIPAAITNVVQARSWISTTSATLPDASLYNGIENVAGGIVPGDNFGVIPPTLPIKLASTTTVYLSAISTFSVSTAAVCGGIYARRRR